MGISTASLDTASRAVLEALLNGLWQGIALAAGVALLLRLLPRTDAATRHLVWWIALAAVAALPLLAMRDSAPPEAHGAGREASVPADPAARTGTVWAVGAPPDPGSLVLLALIGGIAALRLAGIARGVRGLRGLKRRAAPLPASRAEGFRAAAALAPWPRGAEVRVSHEIAGPITVGFRRPMILIPGPLLQALSDAELHAVLLHERAHLRRRDDWTKLAQRVVEALLFFHPVVAWVGRRLDLEREIACDDRVVAAVGGSRAYARCLTRLAELAGGTPASALAPGATPGRSQLARRVAALLAPDRPATERVSSVGLALTAAFLLCSGTALERALPGVSLSTRPAPLAPPNEVRVATSAVPPSRAPAAMPAPPAAAATADRRPVPRREPLPAEEPEPRVVGGCGTACGPTAPQPVLLARVRLAHEVPAPRPDRVAAAVPAAPWRRGTGVEVTIALSLRTASGASALVLPRAGRAANRGWGWDAPAGGSAGAFGRVARPGKRGGGEGWRPYSGLPRRW